ncbi:MAG: hypothetical protein AABW54_02065, partial [Candidatus Micrarchaeota archaeon]
MRFNQLSLAVFAAVLLLPLAGALGEGTLVQHVSDCATGAAVQGALVLAGGAGAYTDAAGVARVYNLGEGVREVTLSASGFQQRSEVVFINACADNVYYSCLAANVAGGTPQVFVSREPAGTVFEGIAALISANSFSTSPISWTRVKYSVGGVQQTVSCAGSYCSALVPPLAQGVTVSFLAEASDSQGNLGQSSTGSFTVQASAVPTPTPAPGQDVLSPALSVSRTPVQVSSSSIVTLVATAADASGVEFTRVKYSVGGGAFSTTSCAGPACFTSFGPLPAGANVMYYAEATDASPRRNSAASQMFYFTVAGAQSSFSVHAFDCTTGVPLAGASLSLAGSTLATNSFGNAVFSSVTSGNYVLSLAAAGFTPASKSVFVAQGATSTSICARPAVAGDVTPPAVSTFRVPSGAVAAGQSVALYANAVDAGGVAWTQVVYSINGGPSLAATCFSSACSAVTGSLAAGANVVFYGQARDANGNLGASPMAVFTVQGSSGGGAGGSGAGGSTAVVHVLECATNQPVAGALVTVAGVSAASDSQGNAVVVGVPSGSQSFAISAVGFEAAVGVVNVSQGVSVFSQCVSRSGSGGGVAGASCSVLVGVPSIAAGVVEDVVISLSNYTSIPNTAAVNCGNGVLASALCAGVGSNSGVCAVECPYASGGFFEITARAGGVLCSATNVAVAGSGSGGNGGGSGGSGNGTVSSNFSTLVVRVVDAGSARRIANALVAVAGSDYFANDWGEVTAQLPAGNYSITVSRESFNSTSFNVTLVAGGLRFFTVPLKYVSSACDFGAELVAPSCSGGTLSFQLRLQNALPVANDLAVAFDSPFAISGPNSISLLAGEARYANYLAVMPVNFAGSRAAVARVSGRNESCAASFAIPLCSQSSISVDVRESELNVFPGGRQCVGVAVRNDGLSETQVELYSSSVLRTSLSERLFTLSAF